MSVVHSILVNEFSQVDPWLTLYSFVVRGEVNMGCRDDLVTPGERPFVDGDITIELVENPVDFRFGDSGVLLDLAASDVSFIDAGKWLLSQLSEDEIDALRVCLVEDWEQSCLRNNWLSVL